ncbi:type 2 periplasmic-binding domain-containing protein [Jiangella alkaliphila]|uniref:Putative aldouronate transport system substrate-binding protein n=1 Tax=Jiangella alkaliphila TaxID=419479 RepID=A0A1H2L832_9ACTN|nr:extracellular solute-binding protein [Jiangella alkaliphila]SDU76885.1 putative aldouronate transport system substrate-binding protein [Jiangella alkaliphila]
MADSIELPRRTLIKALGIGAMATAVPGLLSSCGSGGSGGGSGAGSAGGPAPWPDYIAFDGPTPELPAGSEASSNVFLSYPSELVRAVEDKPGDGSGVSILLSTTAPPPAPAGENDWWQAVNDALGVDLELNLAPADAYTDRLAVVMAGGDLPDVMFIDAFANPPRFDEFVTSQCQDLTEFLAGDAIADYPHLANLPTYAWQALGRFEGGLFGIPVPRSLVSNSLLVNRTLLGGVGAQAGWSRDDFAASMTELSGTQRWGLAHAPFWHNAVHAAAHGAPNGWREENGGFVSMYELPEFRASLEFARELHDAGVYHPESLALGAPDKQTLFVNQTLVGNADGLTAVPAVVDRLAGSFELDFAMPYQVSGATAAWHTGAGAYARLLLKKAPQERIEMLLRVLDFLAAPIGTEEYELVRYGVEGTHFTRGGAGQPEPADAAEGKNPALGPISGGVPVFPGWNAPDEAQRMHAWQEEIASIAVKDPTRSNGLRSATASRSGGTLTALLEDAVNAVVTGREPMSHWDDTVTTWKSDGGDAIAEEFAASYAELEG